jgi:hypothetical protein
MHDLRKSSLQQGLVSCVSNRQVSTHFPFTSSPLYFSRPAFQNYYHHEVHHLGHLVFAVGTSRVGTPATCHEWFVDIILLRTRTVMPADRTSRAVEYKNETLADLLLQMGL